MIIGIVRKRKIASVSTCSAPCCMSVCWQCFPLRLPGLLRCSPARHVDDLAELAREVVLHLLRRPYPLLRLRALLRHRLRGAESRSLAARRIRRVRPAGNRRSPSTNTQKQSAKSLQEVTLNTVRKKWIVLFVQYVYF